MYDVIIIGGGVIGSAIARELSRYQLKIAVLEKELDVCTETSGRNSAVLHAGFNNKPGSLMAKFCVEGSLGFDRTARELDVPFKRTGKLVVGFDDEDMAGIKALKEQGDRNGCPGLEIVGRDRIRALAPHIRGEFALYSPMTGILNAFLLTIGLAENARQNGVEYFFDHEVTSIERREGIYEVRTRSADSRIHACPETRAAAFRTRWVINCAGLFSDVIARMLGIGEYTIYPCRGEYFILDRKLSPLLEMPAYPVPNAKAGGLGIHLTPTVDGTILIGPSAEYIGERDDYASTKAVSDLLVEDGARIFPYLRADAVIRSYTGIRPKLNGREKGGYADFVIEERGTHPRAINLIGIESPGLTSSLPIARHIVQMVGSREDLKEKPDYDPTRRGILCFREQSRETQRRLIEKKPDYGEIVCRCETVTRAEILEAIHNPLGVSTFSGIKVRTRAMMGRCQGGYCQTRIAEMLMREKNLRPEEILYARKFSNLFDGRARE